MKKINKKYDEIMRQADNAVGRKEVVSLLKKLQQLCLNLRKTQLLKLENYFIRINKTP